MNLTNRALQADCFIFESILISFCTPRRPSVRADSIAVSVSKSLVAGDAVKAIVADTAGRMVRVIGGNGSSDADRNTQRTRDCY